MHNKTMHNTIHMQETRQLISNYSNQIDAVPEPQGCTQPTRKHDEQSKHMQNIYIKMIRFKLYRIVAYLLHITYNHKLALPLHIIHIQTAVAVLSNAPCITHIQLYNYTTVAMYTRYISQCNVIFSLSHSSLVWLLERNKHTRTQSHDGQFSKSARHNRAA